MNDKEAIEYLKESVLIYKNTIPKMSKSIETILNLIEKQKAEIEEKDKSLKLHTKLEYQYKNDYLNVIEDLEKKEKIIDLMTNKLALYCEINCEEDIKTNKEQIRQYFENKAKEK